MAQEESPKTFGLQLMVKGTVPPPKTRIRKVSNSEKTLTTDRLSQHRYIQYKRALELERKTNANLDYTQKATELRSTSSPAESESSNISKHLGYLQGRSAFTGNNDTRTITEKSPELITKTANKDTTRNVANDNPVNIGCPSSTMRDKQWYQIYHNFTKYRGNHASRLSAVASEEPKVPPIATCVDYSDLKNLLTSVKLTPREVADQQESNLAPEDSHVSDPLQIDGGSLSSLSDIEDLSELLKDEGNHKEPQLNPMLPSNSIASSINMPSKSQGQILPLKYRMARQHKNTLQRELLQASRRKTKSAPGYRLSSPSFNSKINAPHQPTKLYHFQSSSNTSLRSKSSQSFNAVHSPQQKISRALTADFALKPLEVDFEALKLKKASELKNKPILSPKIPLPRSHWYEMKTPEFHVEAGRHNKHIRNSCNW